MKVSYGAMLIAKERSRQAEEENYTPAHDEQHNNEELARASVCYIEDYMNPFGRGECPNDWPWDEIFWKPTPRDYIRQLTKAGALIAAEIDRLHADEKRTNSPK